MRSAGTGAVTGGTTGTAGIDRWPGRRGAICAILRHHGVSERGRSFPLTNAAPIGVETAQRLDANPDAFLMAVAVAASCAFLTPIGHKNNTIVLGPGGYEFGDYWRMGLPLEVLVLLVGIPMILLVWPL